MRGLLHRHGEVHLHPRGPFTAVAAIDKVGAFKEKAGSSKNGSILKGKPFFVSIYEENYRIGPSHMNLQIFTPKHVPTTAKISRFAALSESCC